MMMMATKQDMVSYKSHTLATTFLSQFTNWAKIWMSPSKIPRKRRNPSITSRETDIRSRTNYYEPPPPPPKYEDLIPNSQKALLYRSTCQKLRPINNNQQQLRKLFRLGDILHVRKFWDDLEMLVYKDLSNTNHYVPPSKRLPFNPDKPGSIYLPRKSRKNIITSKPRKSFASSTIVFSTTEKDMVQVLPVIVPQEDDDDVPLGALHFSNSKHSPLHIQIIINSL